ncbi:hypothetical protein BO85DRAFT_517754 [Aspergillus piperis CBS 112811]|uniref:Uncharacterized protein n=1 Tax=Aspergillus piperis CBS 112811 TaxID=1448313 RepID=A0A8G1VNW2_9EURO|nr:hypothetical protein BO85DRAFT_517754 [Aspergillus piperis CBS 112811]RAH60171.1 hypothetical protein BO85DRAFT_517754 [Aspergillus piperis CBS 112811]
MQTLSIFGRVPLIIVSLSVSILTRIGIGIAGCIPEPLAFVTVTTACGIGAWPASYAVGGEASSLRLRAKSQGLGWFVAGLSSVDFDLVLPYISNPDEGALREMKDRAPSEIDDMFGAVVPARQFRKWSPLIADPPSSDRSPQA